jgi:pilus assembly protein Flp/PilA
MLSIIVFFQTLRMHLEERDEQGQGLAEYGLILALVAIACITALTGLGTAIAGKLTSVAGAL